ncbi:disease resistance protein RGA2 [Sorghum bicolor]|nr:disease resistance protein RGA2 [Sorghum bicolor]XP_021316663.1 disease resistance protein RGA2 [Sorghum bicolor]XP_021316664.1 disease resistance protein RGA2 [Sorghum bicolor]XP_021316665.1 disease resistance protein RGA2 [Sorghum bicolor]|eukprot:XP_021316662.1 disease resistance protein RGA2 [Sorghum bicolor]
MAVVLDALASYLQDMLMEMAKEEVHLLLGVPDEIKKMGIKLGDLKRFLADADKRNITDESVQSWVRELRNAMYDATNIIDLCQLKATEQGPSRDMGCFNPLLFCMRNPLHAHDIGNRIKNLNERLDDIEERSKTFNFINLASYENNRRKVQSSCRARRETTGEDEVSVVGEKIDEDTIHLVDLLTKEKNVHEHKKVMVYAIVGVGGIGKTTLAKKIFNHDIIKLEFEKRMWLSVNQDFSDIGLLERAITEAQGDHQAARNTKGALERILKEALEGCKTLLVMDDVWDHHAWEKVLKPPLINSLARGSCVLVTTRHDTVARGMMAEVPYHHVDKLEQEDAWCLLKNQVVRNENNDELKVDTLKDVGMLILEKCDGLPLAVKVIGGLLRQKKTRRSEWTMILNDSTWSVSQMPEELNYAVYLSYQDLHPELKSCFLYYALLPKSMVFWYDRIVAMWISEGFVHGNSHDLEVLGREYYDQLIARNLLEPDEGYTDNMVCNMHDVVRSFAQFLARDEALIAHKSEAGLTNNINPQNVIRLSLKSNESESNELGWSSLQGHISLRTLILVGKIKMNPGDSLSCFPCLRALHIEDGNFDAFSKSLVQLKHLRYLCLDGTDTSKLPEKIGKMKFLQFIDLSNCKKLVKLPCGIAKLHQLRYISLLYSGINNIPRGFCSLTNLTTLMGFPVHIDGDWCSLEELGSLNQLAHLDIRGLENVSSSSFAIKARLAEKVRLSYLWLQCRGAHRMVKHEEQQQIQEVFDELCPPPCLENLTIQGYFSRQLPKWMTSTEISSLGSLRILVIVDLPYCTELPDGLCQLPSLELLQIKSAPHIKGIGPEFIIPHHHELPRAMENIGSGLEMAMVRCPHLERISNLPKLHNLRIISCPELKVLEGLPSLQRLELVDYDMNTVPAYLQDVNPRDLLLYCDASLLASIAKGKSSPEWDKFSHIKQVKAYANDYYSNIRRKWYVKYTRDPFSFKTNIRLSADASEDEMEELLLDEVEEISRDEIELECVDIEQQRE